MKKLITIVLVLCMLFSLVACIPTFENNALENKNENTGNSSINNKPNGNDSNENSNESNGNSNKLDLSNITDTTGFLGGKAFVRYGEITSTEYRTAYCIDKTGTVLFTLENIQSRFDFSGFFNGLTILKIYGSGTFLCTDKGELIKPSDVGADSFLTTHSQTNAMFEDGYIFVQKAVTTFNGSSTMVAILNSKLETVVDYSEELYNIYRSSNNSWYSGGGYLYYSQTPKTIDTVLDLNTGKNIENFKQFIASAECRYASDLWSYENNCYFDLVTKEIKVDLTQYSETLPNTWYPFEKGLALVHFRSGGKDFVTLIREDGSFCFEPVEIKGTSAKFTRDGDKLLVYSSGAGKEYYVETFDETGKIGELTGTAVGFSITAYISDGIVWVVDTGDIQTYRFYTADLKPFLQ